MDRYEKAQWLIKYVFNHRDKFGPMDLAYVKQIENWISRSPAYEHLDVAVDKFVDTFGDRVRQLQSEHKRVLTRTNTSRVTKDDKR